MSERQQLPDTTTAWTIYQSTSGGGDEYYCANNQVLVGTRPDDVDVDDITAERYLNTVYCRAPGIAPPEGLLPFEFTVERNGAGSEEALVAACELNPVIDGTRPDNYEHEVWHQADSNVIRCFGYGTEPTPPPPDVPDVPDFEWGSAAKQGIFDLSVLVDDVEVRDVTLAGATITVGSSSPTGLPDSSTAFLELISYDAAGAIVSDYPGISFGGGLVSGFTDAYSDRYEGVTTKLVVGATVSVNAKSASGFVDVYRDEYDTGLESTRFTGHITSIDVTPARVALTAVASSERLTRLLVDPSGWPAESEIARLNRIATVTGVPIDVEGTSSFATMIARDSSEKLETAWQLLEEVTDACGGLVYADRYGIMRFRSRDVLPETLYIADPDATLVDNLQMSEELGEVINELEVSWGGGKFILEDLESRNEYGRRARKISIPVSVESEARELAQEELDDHREPFWSLGSATVMVSLADGELMGELLTADLDDGVELPQLLPAFPMRAYQSRLIGYTETLDPYEWRLDLTLDPTGMTRSNT
jgi:hypothetical protein